MEVAVAAAASAAVAEGSKGNMRRRETFRSASLFITAALVLGISASCEFQAEAVYPEIITVPSEGSYITEPAIIMTNESTVSVSSTDVPGVSETNASSVSSNHTTRATTSETTEETTMITTKVTTVETTAVPQAKTALLTAFSTVNVSGWSDAEIRACFYAEEISDEVFARMDGKSFKADCTTKRSDLRYVRVLHIGFDGNVRVGELVANKKIAQDFIDIFYELYVKEYPIEKMVLVDEYGADDNLSMADNNTSCFNFRRVVGSKTLSRHALGMAIDINPLYNPWIYELDGVPITDPPGGAPYIDRTVDCPYIIDHDDLCYKLLIRHGFTWGGDWTTSKDYQHFSKAG